MLFLLYTIISSNFTNRIFEYIVDECNQALDEYLTIECIRPDKLQLKNVKNSFKRIRKMSIDNLSEH